MVQFGASYAGTGWWRLSDFAFGDQADSMRSRRDNDSWLAKDFYGGQGQGTKYCADSHSVDSTFYNNPIGPDSASGFRLTQTDSDC